MLLCCVVVKLEAGECETVKMLMLMMRRKENLIERRDQVVIYTFSLHL